MYKVIPWDDPEEIRCFETWLDAYQYGMRFDLIEAEKEGERNE